MVLKKGLKVIALFLFCITIINAHPVHETNVSIYRGKDHKGSELAINKIEVSALFNWQQLCVIVEETKNIVIKDVNDIENYKEDIFEWFNKSVLLEVDGNKVELSNFTLPSVEKDELLFGKGMELFGYATIADSSSVVEFSSNMFPEEHEQKTRVYYYKNGGMPLVEKVIKDNENLFLDIKTDAVKSDIKDTITKDEEFKKAKEQSFLDKVAKKLLNNSEKSFFMILILVFLLGMLHTMEAGHSKLIISSYMLNHHVTVKDGFVYTTIFTLTHIADIILLGIILLVVDSFVNIYAKMDQLQQFSIYALVFIAGWLFIKNVGNYLRLKVVGYSHSHSHHGHSHSHHDHKHHDHKHHDHKHHDHKHHDHKHHDHKHHDHKHHDHKHHDHDHHDHDHHDHDHHDHDHHDHDHHDHDHHDHDHHDHDHHDHDHHDHDHDHDDLELSEAELEHARAHGMAPDRSLKEQLMLGFVTGLAPCLMGWSVFMMVLTTKNLWTLFPVILSFGLGIFVALSIFVVVIAKTRHLVLGKFKIFQELSPVISSLLILSLAIWLLVH